MSLAFLVFLVAWIVGMVGTFIPAVPATLIIFLGSVAAALLDGYRGRPRGDAAALARAIAGLSQLAAANPAIDTIEVNPVMVMPDGEGIVALDAVVTMTP